MGSALYNGKLRSRTYCSQVKREKCSFGFHCSLFIFLSLSPCLRLAEILEDEAQQYMQKDPDPFDERHPSRIDPLSELGKNLKLLFKKEQFMSRLVNDYLRDNFFTRQSMDKSSLPLNLAACRLILIIMPGLETSAVFQVQNDQLINRLYEWAEKGEEPLRSYATGLLGAAMDIQDIAVAFREQNIRMLPLLLQRLKSLQMQYKKYGNISSLSNGTTESTESSQPRPGTSSEAQMNGHCSSELTESLMADENSQSTQERSVQKNMILLNPPTIATSQMMILRYLTPMGEYQEFLPFIFEHNAMDIIFSFIEKVDPKDLCLAFEALKYLASLLCHKKCCIEFLSRNGLQVSFLFFFTFSKYYETQAIPQFLETSKASTTFNSCHRNSNCSVLFGIL